MFDLLPMDIITIINDWIIRSEYKYKHKKIVSQFTRQKILVLHTLAHKQRKPHHNYGTLQFYITTIYKWACILEKTPPIGIYMRPQLTKNKH